MIYYLTAVLVEHVLSFSFPITLCQMEIVWDELGSKFKDLLEMGRSGVVASVVAACQRLHSNENKVRYANHDP